ncbi:MAG: T9SS type A sorting domain-containing protein [Bacteroidales bacterium]|jgi:hypothetical protein|nr:T9SS type A sorting domain-containing protein [Bacteroidales bacterium]
MKKLLFIFVAFSFSSQLLAQVSSSYVFATGTTAGVNIIWDAYNDQTTIEGCYLYKKVNAEHEYELLNNELIVSEDSTYSFNDQGVFDPDFPPIYAIHIVTADSVYVKADVYAFETIAFEVPADKIVAMQLKAWNSTQCCQMAKLWIDDTFIGDFGYDNLFSYNFDLESVASPEFEGYLVFEDNSGMLGYAEFSVTGTYLFWVLNTVGEPEMEEIAKQFAPYPNPASDAAWLQLPENTPLAQAQVELYSSSGRLLHKAKPGSHFHKIDVAHLPKGLYLVRLWDGKEWMITKLLKD